MKELQQFDIPEVCPYCGEQLSFDGIHLICENPDCDGKALFKFMNGFSIIDVKGAGDKMIEEFFECGFKSIFQIFDKSLFNEQELAKNGMKVTKNVTKFILNLSKVTTLELYQVIMMLGIDNMGISTAKQIANKIAKIKYDFSGLEKEVVEGWDVADEKYLFLLSAIEKLSNNGVKVNFPKEVSNSGIGVEFTGSPKPAFKTKDEFLKTITDKGFIHTAIKDAKILVTDSYDSTSSKMSAAKKKGIEIITYTDFATKYCK